MPRTNTWLRGLPSIDASNLKHRAPQSMHDIPSTVRGPVPASGTRDTRPGSGCERAVRGGNGAADSWRTCRRARWGMHDIRNRAPRNDVSPTVDRTKLRHGTAVRTVRLCVAPRAGWEAATHHVDVRRPNRLSRHEPRRCSTLRECAGRWPVVALGPTALPCETHDAREQDATPGVRPIAAFACLLERQLRFVRQCRHDHGCRGNPGWV